MKLEFQKLIDKYQLSPACVAEELPTYTAEAEILEAAERAEACLALWRKAAYVTVYGTPDLAALAVECETGADSSLMAEIYVNRYAGDWRALLSALFAPDIRKVGHNVKDMMRALLAQGLPADGFIFDTALAAYLVDATAGSYDLQRLFVTYYNEQLPQPDHLTADAFNPLAGENIAAQTALISYTAAVSALHGTLAPKLRELEMEELYYNVELPLCRVLADMETAGFLVDRDALADFGVALQKITDRVEQAIYDAAGETFNINSPKQLGYILFEKLQLPHGKKTRTGWSTNADVLEKLRHAYPIVDDVLCFRQYTKLKSTYVEGLMKVIDMDGRIRTSFQMTVTATGRLSSTEPNLQNIPTRTELGSQLRRMFTAAEGCVLVDADYSQIELRLLAHMSGDKVMQASFLSGADFHTATAAKVFHVPEEDVTPELRRRAKAVNFGIVYGISAFALAQDIGVTVAEAKAYMDRYFETYSTLRQYMTDVVAQAEQDGYVQTMMHRRRPLPELKSSNFNLREFGKRVALNMPVQGSAADIMKLAMVRVHDRLKREGLRARLLMQVHDELIAECPAEEQAQVKRILTEEMEHAAVLSVPLTVDAHCGKTGWRRRDKAMKHIKIVPMAAEHLNDVAALELACFSRPWSRQMLAEELDNQCAAFLVALEPETEKVIGYAGLLVAADEGYITNVAVDPSRRRQGVAAQLLQVFDNFARGNQLAFLTLEVRPSNTAAIALYQGFGFREVGRRRNYYDLPKEDALILTKYYTEEAAQ